MTIMKLKISAQQPNGTQDPAKKEPVDRGGLDEQ
jgi:hypothetical protein